MLAALQYVQDYDEKFPMIRVNVSPNTTVDWRNLIQPYLKNVGVTGCPSNPDQGTLYQGDCTNDVNPDTTTGYTRIRVDRGYGWATIGDQNSSNGFSYGAPKGGEKLASFQYPATTLTITESRSSCTDNCAWCYGNDFCHMGKGNYAFVDGHVKTLSPVSTYAPVCMWLEDNNNQTPCWTPDSQNMNNFGNCKL